MNRTLKLPETPESFVFHRRIGSTTYKVGIHFNPQAEEALDDKVLRLVKNDLQHAPDHAKMDTLQAGWLSERSS